jgi:hypothetical protein
MGEQQHQVRDNTSRASDHFPRLCVQGKIVQNIDSSALQPLPLLHIPILVVQNVTQPGDG